MFDMIRSRHRPGETLIAERIYAYSAAGSSVVTHRGARDGP